MTPAEIVAIGNRVARDQRSKQDGLDEMYADLMAALDQEADEE